MRTPGLLLFLHLAPAALTLWLLGAQGVLELRPLRCAVLCCAVLCCDALVGEAAACLWAGAIGTLNTLACQLASGRHVNHEMRPTAPRCLASNLFAACGRCRADYPPQRWQACRYDAGRNHRLALVCCHAMDATCLAEHGLNSHACV